MKFRKFLSLVMVFLVVLGYTSAFAESSESLTVYLSVSRYGEIVADKDSKTMAYAEVVLTGKESYNLDDVFSLAHSLYFEDGEEGYASSHSQWGFGIDKFWGDTSYNFGYQVNRGEEFVSGLDYIVETGDFIDAFIYKNAYPDTEGYAMFDKQKHSAYIGRECELTLEYFSGYDENWNNIISPCEDAVILINGEETEYKTDADGKVTLCFESEGVYIISAKKTKLIGENEVPAITAPVCILDVSSPPELNILHNIAGQYKNIDFSVPDGNLPWIIADMLTYEELFPQSENNLSDEQKEIAAATIAKSVIDAERPGDLAKYILAIRALGYDAKNIYTDDFIMVDAVEKLTDLIDLKDESVTNVYTVPYVIIALSQDGTYATQEQMEWLIQSVKDSKAVWQSVDYGTDALTPIMLSLSPYYESDEEIRALCDETAEILKAEQREDGLIDGFEGYESASTGLAICAFSSLGMDSSCIRNGDNSLVSGLLSTADTEIGSFPNAFATEQGFRGLLSLMLLNEKNGRIYDFKDRPVNELNIPKIRYCPVIFQTNPGQAVIMVEGVEKSAENYYDIPEGTYKYSVYAPGYEIRTGEFVIGAEEAEKHILKKISVALQTVYSGGGGGGGGSRPVKNEKNEKEENKTNDSKTEDVNEEEAGEEKTEIFRNDTFSDVSESDWHYSAVKYVYENGLFNGTDKGFEPEMNMTRAMLVTVLHRLDSVEKTTVAAAFSDVPEDAWYAQSVGWALENKLVNGMSENIFAPDDDITREQLAVILYRYALHKGYDVSVKDAKIPDFSDKEEISSYAEEAMGYVIAAGIVNGRSENTLAPKAKVTRAEVAAMMMRFSEVRK